VDFSDYPVWIMQSLGEYQLSVDDRWRARLELRHHVEEKYGGYSRRKKETFARELARVERLEDWGLCMDFIRAFQPRLDVSDDLWRRCDRLYWRYQDIWKRDPDEFFMMLRVVKYANIFDQLEPDRDYEMLRAELEREESQAE